MRLLTALCTYLARLLLTLLYIAQFTSEQQAIYVPLRLPQRALHVSKTLRIGTPTPAS
jgi:hypothetical protein